MPLRAARRTAMWMPPLSIVWAPKSIMQIGGVVRRTPPAFLTLARDKESKL